MLNRLPEFGLERYFAQWEFTAPWLLCASDIEGLKLTELLALADDESRGLWNDLSLGYTESTGLPILRREIASFYENVSPDDVLTFAGAEEAILVALASLLDADDHVDSQSRHLASRRHYVQSGQWGDVDPRRVRRAQRDGNDRYLHRPSPGRGHDARTRSGQLVE